VFGFFVVFENERKRRKKISVGGGVCSERHNMITGGGRIVREA
jgi:hypothetical protein